MLKNCTSGNLCTDSSIISVADYMEPMANSIGYLKADNTDPSNIGTGERFGGSVSFSRDGNTLAVGAYFENTTDEQSGAVYVFTRTGASWSQQAFLKASNIGDGDRFGWSVSLSLDGDTLAVGARAEDGDVNSDGSTGGSNNNEPNAGAVYVFTRTGGTNWNQTAYIKADNAGSGVAVVGLPNSGVGDLFGQSVSLSDGGTILVVSARLEDSDVVGTTGATGSADDLLADSGAVYVFTHNGTSWDQTAYIKASNPGAGDRFGQSISISGDGDILAVSAYREDSDDTSVNDATHTDVTQEEETGAVYTFTRNVTTGEWTQQAYIKASNTDKNDKFGLSLSKDGLTLAVGAEREASSADGIGGNQSLDDLANAGAAYVFSSTDGTDWTQQAYIKASNPGNGDEFGRAISLSADGNTLAVGARYEDEDTVGISNTGGLNDMATRSGAVYTYTRSVTTWSSQAYVKANNTDDADEFGWSVGLTVNADGLQTLAVGARMEDSNAQGIGGDQTNNDTSEAGAVYLY